MKLNRITLGLTATVMALGFATQSFAGDEKEVKITMDKVPEAVQKAVKEFATDAEIKGIEDSDVDGTKVIEFDIEKNGKASEVAFRPNGKLFSTEGEVALADVPEAVQKIIAEKSVGAKAGAPEKVVQEGKTTYEVVIEKDGKKIEYTLSPEGKVTDKEEVGKD
jgi:KaiC/GvpD/RAD55 family RecA-like ATPase